MAFVSLPPQEKFASYGPAEALEVVCLRPWRQCARGLGGSVPEALEAVCLRPWRQCA